MAVEGKQDDAARKPRRRGAAKNSDTPFSGEAMEARGTEAIRAYVCSLYALIPGVGLLLGPLAVLLGLWALWRNRGDAAFKGHSLCHAAILLGVLLTITQWCGLWLMIRGLQTVH